MSNNEIYLEAYRNLGRHLSLNQEVPEETGCVEAVSWVLLNCGFPIPSGGIQGVNALIDWMLKNGFTEVDAPHAGDVITAHSPDANNPNFAHTGICGVFDIMSNTSANGRFQANYSYGNWEAYFNAHGSQTRYFSAPA